ncbi:MAG: class I SAM-dependent methyltransferase [candidate division Zixibacteria bacterium]|nr:class I SAM-dependent methyltransferase [candidate division Zixibacteria bacterium]
MQRSEYTAANRAAWNEAAPLHQKQNFEELLAAFRQPGYNRLDRVATEQLKAIGLESKAVVHLCCNNGRELLSVKNLGAGRCVGIDISDGFVEQARTLSKAAGLDCEFHRHDIYDIPATYDGQFDLTMITVGALGWMPRIDDFFGTVVRLLKPGGWLAIYEMHPLLDMFDEDDPMIPPQLKESYFREKPFVDVSGLDYYGHSQYKSAPMYWFHHKLCDIIQGCLDHGLSIKHFREYEHDISAVFANFERQRISLPLSYTLTARRG